MDTLLTYLLKVEHTTLHNEELEIRDPLFY